MGFSTLFLCCASLTVMGGIVLFIAQKLPCMQPRYANWQSAGDSLLLRCGLPVNWARFFSNASVAGPATTQHLLMLSLHLVQGSAPRLLCVVRYRAAHHDLRQVEP